MKAMQCQWRPGSGWATRPGARFARSAQLVLVFGARRLLEQPGICGEIRSMFPAACIAGASTSGEIHDDEVCDDSIVVTAVKFDRARVRGVCLAIDTADDSEAIGLRLAQHLVEPDLAHLLVFSDGLHVNGSALVSGLSKGLPASVAVTGGLAGDGADFVRTVVVWEGASRSPAVVAVGLYGEDLRVGCGSLGGWDAFGPERVITRSSGNVLYEMDGRSALALYKEYLGEHAVGLPATGLLFPLALLPEGGGAPIVRTILAVDETAQSLTFAGDVPMGAHARLMKANIDRLIGGAHDAALRAKGLAEAPDPDLALLISCVGRRLVLHQRVEEEIEAAREVFGKNAVFAGFYSYGEISPFTPEARCALHNQTMTITTFTEREAP